MISITRHRWVFAVCSAALFAVLAFLTSMALRAEGMEHEARKEREYQETIRQALWRMDLALTPILVQEASRPAEHYTAVYTEERVVSMKGKGAPISMPVQRIFSPLLGFRSEWIRLHFTLQSKPGVEEVIDLFSPQIPTPIGLSLDEVESATTAFPEEVRQSRERLESLESLLSNPLVRERLAFSASAGTLRTKAQAPPQAPQSSFQIVQAQQKEDQQFLARQNNLEWAQNALVGNQAAPPESLKASWVLPPLSSEPELFLMRTGGRSSTRQGIWLDWPHLEKWLCQGISDLFPAGRLRPAAQDEISMRGLMLASIPAVFDPGSWSATSSSSFPILWWFLIAAWIISIASFAALRYALASATELSERRGQFVSAVTHELRTPLTTFQLYSQMLADGMVPEEAVRKEYLETLKRESERLARIVESVLLYARVEGKRAPQHREILSVSDLVERVRPALSLAAQKDGMELQIDVAKAGSVLLDTDPQIVQQILLNLVDNSCKYARGATDRTLHLEMTSRKDRVEIVYFDRGPGIAREDEGKLFQPFQRGAAHVAGSISGSGLGLSLARALASDLGGNLSFVKRSDVGACFLLQLPHASK